MLSYKIIGAQIAKVSTTVIIALLAALSAVAQVSSASPDRPKPEPRAQQAAPTSTGIEITKEVPATQPVAENGAGDKKPTTDKGDGPAPNAGEAAVTPTTNPVPQPAPPCKRMLTADVVAMPQPLMLNRLGAAIPDGLIFALKGDTVMTGNRIALRPGKRPRPLVLRANVGDCLTINFTNAIPASTFTTTFMSGASGGTTEVSLHIQGVEWVKGPQDDAAFVGKNNSSLASAAGSPAPMPPQTLTYTVFARQEGVFLMYTMGDTSSLGQQLVRGLFGSLNVQPAGAEWYRSQVTADDLLLATYNANKPDQVPPGSLNCSNATNCVFNLNGHSTKVLKTPAGFLNTLDNHPLVDYNAKYPSGKPVLKMLDNNNNIVHSDLTAIITGPKAGRFPGTTGVNKPEPPCNAENNPALPSGKIDPLFCGNPASPDRKQPYREITVMYHGGLTPVVAQAFPVFADSSKTPGSSATIAQMLVAGQDAFAINYGTGGIGAEVYANRIGVGPMGACSDCKFEEFFLSAWPIGDPAMLVDKPANSQQLATNPPFQPPCNTTASFNQPPCGGQRSSNSFPYTMTPQMKATAAFFPDDPSNVYHSYINDHVKFRILQSGRDVSHVHHQHAHQWLQSPNSDEGSYLDSQMLSPGASYTLEMVYNGSGNRNKVVGDSIFHCHFYPHFAAGMWAMWRTHDTFESGTFVFPNGQVVPGSRALPDGEIEGGSPTPAIVPMPTIPMAPLPAYAQIQHGATVNGVATTFGGQVVIGGTCQSNKINGLDVIGGCTNGAQLNGTVLNSQFNGMTLTGQFQPSPGNQILNPGFPYFIPGIAGARAPHPPLDFAPDGAGGFLDGGMPRHVVTGGSIGNESHDTLDWSKDLATMKAVQLPEVGTDVEKAAMTFFGKRCYPTFFPDGTPGKCPSPPSQNPQSTLNQPPTGFLLNGLPRGPQPGAPFADPAIDDNGKPVGTKRTYKAAAFQLDVVFNKKRWHYPQQRMLSLWNDVAPTLAFNGTSGRQPEPLFFRGNSGDIIEYWHTNLVPNYYLVDDFQVRTPTDILGQHIHLVKFDVTSSDGAGNGFNYEDGTFSPEEVQEMFAALNKPGGSWTHCTGCPTDLRPPQPPPADICSGPQQPAQCAHDWLGAQTTIQRWYLDPLVDDSGVDRTLRTVFTHDHFGPSTHQQAGLYAGLLVEPQGSTWTSNDGATTFGSRSDGGPTSWQARILTRKPADSYREFMLEFQDMQLAYAWATIGSESPPITKPNPDPKKGWIDPAYAINAPSQSPTSAAPTLISTGTSAVPPGTQSVNYLNDPLAWRVGQFGDLSNVYDSAFKQASNLPPNGDPGTPLMRAYQNDNVQVRLLVGAHVFAHQFDLLGPTWFAEPSWKNSGYRSAQPMGLSEHFELLFKVPASSAPSTGRKCPDGRSSGNCADYLYSPSMDGSGLSNGLWGLFRSYDPTQTANALAALPNNPIGAGSPVSYSTCPAALTPPAVKRVFNITAVTSQKAVAGGQIVFNDRSNKLTNKQGVLYVRSEDLDAQGKLIGPVEPLILRANAGDCVEVNLTNAIDPSSDVFQARFFMAPPFNGTNPSTGQPVFQSQMSGYVGLHPQLLSYDAAQSYGMNVGWNSQGQTNQLAAFGKTVKYQWYAGKIDRDASGKLNYTPVEFGTLNLFPSDPFFQHINGLIGQMIIEPPGSSWNCGEVGTKTSCDATGQNAPTTRASATITLTDKTEFREFSLMLSDEIRISPNADGTTNSAAVNFRTEPFKFRYTNNATNDFSCMLSNLLVQQAQNNPQTPIFTAGVGNKVRFRLSHPFGTGTSQVFTLHGHVWQRNPYVGDSKQIGTQPLSQWLGSRDNHGSTDHFDLVVDKAGGEAGREGDYLYTVFVPIQARQGTWGVFRVGDPKDPQPNAACTPVSQPGYVPKPPKDGLDGFIRPPLNQNTKNQ